MRTLLFLCLLTLASCTAPTNTYVAADRLTHDALAPEYRAYVLADPLLDQQAKDRRLLVTETWRMRLEAAEAVK